jgi:hypothetical protein
MATGENVLWVVEKRWRQSTYVDKRWVFRTREAAQDFASYKEARAKLFRYNVYRATWGPEQ